MFFPLAALLTASAASALTILENRAQITDFTQSPVAFTYPPGRGFNAATASTAACGGMAPNTTRTIYPMTGGDISLTQRTNTDNVNILYTNETNPTRFHAFSTYANSILDLGSGHYCTKAPDFGAMGYKAGQDVTMLVIYQLDGTTTYYYTCADITLAAVGSASINAPQYVCGNYTDALKVAGQDDTLSLTGSTTTTSGAVNPHTTAAGASATGTTSSSSGLTAAAGGGIGAGVAIGAVALLALLAYFAGFVRFGKRQEVLLDSQSATSSETPMKEHRV